MWGAYPTQGKTIRCYVDGVPKGHTGTQTFTFPDVPLGMHNLCCALTQDVVELTNCEAVDCVTVKISRSCDEQLDSICVDGNPCSVDACLNTLEGYKCRHGPNMSNPACCTSTYDCSCADSLWEECDNNICQSE